MYLSVRVYVRVCTGAEVVVWERYKEKWLYPPSILIWTLF